MFFGLVGLGSLGTVFYKVPGAFAQELTMTAAQTEGPYSFGAAELDRGRYKESLARRTHPRRRYLSR